MGGGAIVPSVKSGLPEPSSEIPAPAPIPSPPVYQPRPPQVPASDRAVVEAEVREDDREAAETDKDLLCPICVQIIKDVCYLCIVTHLQNKSDCPSCASYLTTNQIFPDFLLNKLLIKASAHHIDIAKHASPTEQLCQAVQQLLIKASAHHIDIAKHASPTEQLRQALQQFNDLQECYLHKQRYWAKHGQKQEERDSNHVQREGYHHHHPGLKDFQSVLSSFTQYSRLRVVAELRHGDLFNSANIISSIEFDRDDEFFATAGVSRRIKVFDFASVVNEQEDVQCPIVEMPTCSKLSCLSWNKYTKSYIASSDYDGIVTVWDVNTRQSIMEYEEHEKRAWSVDFSRTDPTMLVSGSDDCKVKIWCTRQEASALNIDMKENICSVKYNPGSSFHIAVGSADHHIHYYDLRNISQPLHVFRGHRKTVSYVKFVSNSQLASASTDHTLRLWDVKQNIPLRKFRGHTNEKNFVGLTVSNDYIACGSETNEVFVYHKDISRSAAWHRFSSETNEGAGDDPGSYFISAVCWKSDSPTMLTANSQGTIKVLVLDA